MIYIYIYIICGRYRVVFSTGFLPPYSFCGSSALWTWSSPTWLWFCTADQGMWYVFRFTKSVQYSLFHTDFKEGFTYPTAHDFYTPCLTDRWQISRSWWCVGHESPVDKHVRISWDKVWADDVHWIDHELHRRMCGEFIAAFSRVMRVEFPEISHTSKLL